jgi:hypothetical protein
MPLRRNVQVLRLLTWHGHDSGGVQVPFQRSSPLGQPIDTTLILKLRLLARAIANGDETPRGVFLIGGPGNGKSETVQDFLVNLDESLGMQGNLRRLLTDKFRPDPISPRRIVVESKDVASSSGDFANRVGRLIVIQDATATDDALGNAALQLANDISDLMNGQEVPMPLFVACANRGILARALREARQQWGAENRVTELIAELIRASSIGYEASLSKQHRLACWPLASDSRIACWPLDLESLIVASSTNPSPIEQVVDAATKSDEWKVCVDCDAASLCPFKQNAVWLQESSNRKACLDILRRSELYTGQRWNFRDAFSLVAETVIGQWSDFGESNHPCDWVHSQVDQLTKASRFSQEVAPLYLLLHRLYPHALFPKTYPQLAENYGNQNWSKYEVSEVVFDRLLNTEGSALKPIRETLLGDFSNLDPAIFSPSSKDHPLRKIEDEYSQSIELGNDAKYTPGLSLIEEKFLTLLQIAEAEWEQELLGRRSSQAFKVVLPLRQLASTVVKRSIGVRLGHHASEEHLTDFEASLLNQSKLNKIKEILQDLLGGSEIVFNMLESFGQPQAEQEGLITLKSSRAGLRAVLPPSTTSSAPGHDVPFFEISGKHRIPITFDLYSALCLKRKGCSSSSLPASVRAAIDRVRHQYAGELCRDKEKVINGITSIVVGKYKKIELTSEDAEPSLSDL